MPSVSLKPVFIDQTRTENVGRAAPSAMPAGGRHTRAVAVCVLAGNFMPAQVARPPCAKASTTERSTRTRKLSVSGRGRELLLGASGTLFRLNAPAEPLEISSSVPAAG